MTTIMGYRTTRRQMKLQQEHAKRCVVCPHCEYDRRFPGFEAGGWMQQDNNGPIVACPVCNPNGKQPRK